MIQEIHKEIQFGLRNSRFLVLAIGFIFFAVLTPIMMKVVLPQILASQFPDLSAEALQGMFNASQLGTIQSYMGDAVEIGSIIVAFALCGLLAQEIKDNTLVLPLCSGKRLGNIVGAKMIVFGMWLVFSTTIALVIDYVYAGLLFSFDIGLAPILRGGVLQGLYMVFLLASLIMWGALLKNPLAAGFASLATVFGLQIGSNLLKIQKYTPAALLAEAQQLAPASSPHLLTSLCITVVIITVFLAITFMRLQNMEWNQR